MIKFYKYQGAGNDFILIDNREGIFNISDAEKVKALCNRQFGIGSDGIITVENATGYDFKMLFANPDGSMGAMCGNGGRCIVSFAHNILKIVKDPKKVKFLAVDGEHEAEILENREVKLKMQDMKGVENHNGLNFMLCGTAPHYIEYISGLQNFPVVVEARKIRDNKENKRGNVNYVEYKDGILNVRTYERGVEDETLACGTGATSVALASHHLGIIKDSPAQIKMPGGTLTIEFEKSSDETYKNIYLTGPAVCVFEGEITL